MNSNVITKINHFVKNRLIELGGFCLVIFSFFLLVSILSYSPSDPNFIYGSSTDEIKNLGGFYGSIISDFLLQAIGLISFFFIINLTFWGFKIALNKKIEKFPSKVFFTLIYIIFGTTLVNIFYNDTFWLIDNGNGGFVGKIIKENIYILLESVEDKYINIIFLLTSIIFFILSLGIKGKEIKKILFLPLSIIKLFFTIFKKSEKKMYHLILILLIQI